MFSYRTIYKPVYYGGRGYYYQYREDTPLMGPFNTRAEAVADCSFRVHYTREWSE